MCLLKRIVMCSTELACKECLHAIGSTDGHVDAHAQLIVCPLNVCFLTGGCSYGNIVLLQRYDC